MTSSAPESLSLESDATSLLIYATEVCKKVEDVDARINSCLSAFHSLLKNQHSKSIAAAYIKRETKLWCPYMSNKLT
jgi:hypothetical protein